MASTISDESWKTARSPTRRRGRFSLRCTDERPCAGRARCRGRPLDPAPCEYSWWTRAAPRRSPPSCPRRAGASAPPSPPGDRRSRAAGRRCWRCCCPTSPNPRRFSASDRRRPGPDDCRRRQRVAGRRGAGRPRLPRPRGARAHGTRARARRAVRPEPRARHRRRSAGPRGPAYRPPAAPVARGRAGRGVTMAELFPFSQYWWLYAAFTGGVLLLLALDLCVLHRARTRSRLPGGGGVERGVGQPRARSSTSGSTSTRSGRFPRRPPPGRDPRLRPGGRRPAGRARVPDRLRRRVLAVRGQHLRVRPGPRLLRACPPAYQHRVLFYGILGALVFRAALHRPRARSSCSSTGWSGSSGPSSS